ncbi:nitrous oxide reductase family maturation protein NosD [Pseudogracilibacillus auburnensis]|uniref:Nitrous oxidase accessory protein n=1 Tax=Pseudogracilibacillus auburnensis TaxID=1494959 RepID=A0A2V3W1D4_9BACI|nr:NosD domain-containing protein [Pseudogracilibacillus auburnensis]PXW87576.1 nitrous oxidase accessory protein [Pseudogracilibacillus auburnensis]
MKRIITSLLFSVLLFISIPTHTLAEKSIQQQIDEATIGDTIILTDGQYEENIVIDKAIKLIGNDGVTFIQQTSEPMISVQANDVVIERIKIHNKTDYEDSAAILLNGNNNVLKNLEITTNGYGIKLDQADNNELSHITITGNEDTPLSKRQHGIDLWKSHHNEIHHTYIKHVKDAIYIEHSNETSVHHNDASHSRYGYHLMFTKNTTIEHNESYENVSGMMIMGTNGTNANHNSLKHNQKNVQSLGLLLFDVEDATITNNDISNNRVGIFVESASHNDISMNNVQSNYIGLQFKGAKSNVIHHNSFTANVVQGQAEDSSNNITNENYWGDHFGFDLTGDNVSDLTYEVHPFYLIVTNEYPPFQLLFQSPGMIFLEQLLHTPIEERLIDQSPLLKSPLHNEISHTDHQMLLFLFSFSLFFISLIIIFMGVKKR